MSFTLILPLVAQLGSAATFDGARLAECLEQARTDPTTAIVTASVWIGDAEGASRSDPQQCLGMAFTRLLRWQAAEQAFLAARDMALESDRLVRARLGAMAGNSAAADGRPAAALADLDQARDDAKAAGDNRLAGEIELDRSRNLVALARMDDAAEALANARIDAPQNYETWLLSATLARRMDDLAGAQARIAVAAQLAPQNPAVGLEAGLVAALAGQDEAARKSWQSVIEIAAGSPEAEAARTYLAQLDEGAPE